MNFFYLQGGSLLTFTAFRVDAYLIFVPSGWMLVNLFQRQGGRLLTFLLSGWVLINFFYLQVGRLLTFSTFRVDAY